MITNNSTDVHDCDIVSSRSSPSHFTKDIILLLNKIYPKRSWADTPSMPPGVC